MQKVDEQLIQLDWQERQTTVLFINESAVLIGHEKEHILSVRTNIGFIKMHLLHINWLCVTSKM